MFGGGDHPGHPLIQKDKVVLEQIQWRATKLIVGMENKPYSEQLKELNLPSLVYRRKHGDMIQAHKILSTNQENELLEIDPSHITWVYPKQICKLHARTGPRCSFFSNQQMYSNAVWMLSGVTNHGDLTGMHQNLPPESNQPPMQLSSQGVIQQDQKSLFHSKLWFKVILRWKWQNELEQTNLRPDWPSHNKWYHRENHRNYFMKLQKKTYK